VIRNGWKGPVLITGESGAGKTWLARRLAGELPTGWLTASVEVTSELNGLEFLRLVGHAMGLTMSNRLGTARLRLAAGLEDRASEGRLTLLILEEVQRSSRAVWEELQCLITQMGRPSGFAAMMVLGRTELARELASERLIAFATNLSLHIHLKPLDLDEARELLRVDIHAGGMDEGILERIHRDCHGNPKRLLRAASAQSWRIGSIAGDRHARIESDHSKACQEALSEVVTRSGNERDEPASSSVSARELQQNQPDEPLPLMPTRPPIRVEDGLVEVGWDGEPEPETPGAVESLFTLQNTMPATTSAEEELIEDRCAALQAWTEWTRNRERLAEDRLQAGKTDPPSGGGLSTVSESSSESPQTSSNSGPVASLTNLRAESSHDFAPYNQLFTRLRQSRST
jgi:general secretion pathway protein A